MHPDLILEEGESRRSFDLQYRTCVQSGASILSFKAWALKIHLCDRNIDRRGIPSPSKWACNQNTCPKSRRSLLYGNYLMRVQKKKKTPGWCQLNFKIFQKFWYRQLWPQTEEADLLTSSLSSTGSTPSTYNCSMDFGFIIILTSDKRMVVVFLVTNVCLVGKDAW